MAAKTPGKGTALLMSISAVYTAVPQMINIDVSGEESQTFNGRTLDGNVHSDMPPTGYVSNPTIGGEFFYDSGNVVHQAIKTAMRAPPASTNFKITDVATAPLSTIWAVTGIGMDEKYATDDGVKATLKLQTSGNPS